MNLSSIIDRAAINFADKTALISDRHRFTYRHLKSAIERVAFYLNEHGIGRGDRVAIFMPNRPEWVAAYYGIIRLGAVAVCASSAYKHKELEHLINDCLVSLLITCDELLPQVPQREAVPSLKDVVVWENDRHMASIFDSRSALNKPFLPVGCDLNDECAILFTGGTTGTPKGAMLTHR